MFPVESRLFESGVAMLATRDLDCACTDVCRDRLLLRSEANVSGGVLASMISTIYAPSGSPKRKRRPLSQKVVNTKTPLSSDHLFELIQIVMQHDWITLKTTKYLYVQHVTIL